MPRNILTAALDQYFRMPSVDEFQAFFPGIGNDMVRVLEAVDDPIEALERISALLGADGVDHKERSGSKQFYIVVPEASAANPQGLTLIYNEDHDAFYIESAVLWHGAFHSEPTRFDKPVSAPPPETKRWFGGSTVYRGARYRPAADYEDVGFTETGRWGNQGSGLLLTDGRRIFLGLRSPDVEEPNTWGIPGGAIPEDVGTGEFKDAQQSANDEFDEEMGAPPPPYRLVDQVVYEEPGFRYTTFIGQVDPVDADRIVPRFNWENTDADWFARDELADLGTHFGLDYVLAQTDPFIEE